MRVADAHRLPGPDVMEDARGQERGCAAGRGSAEGTTTSERVLAASVEVEGGELYSPAVTSRCLPERHSGTLHPGTRRHGQGEKPCGVIYNKEKPEIVQRPDRTGTDGSAMV